MAAASSTGEAIGTGLKVGLAVTGSFGFVQAATSAQAAGTTVAKNMGQWHDAFDTFSFGIGAGGSFLHAPASISTTDTYSGTYDGTLSGTLNGSGFTGTVEAGKDFRQGNFVFGIYGDITAGDRTQSFNRSYADNTDQVNSNPPVMYNGTYKVRFGHSASLIGRAGWMPNERTLLYGLAGYTWQHYDATASASTTWYDPVITENNSASRSATTGGLTLGVGGEMLLTPDISLKGEYRWTHLNGVPSFGVTTAGYHGNNTVTMTGRTGAIDEHAIRFVLSFKLH